MLEDTNKPKKFMVAMLDFFGKKPNQSNLEFGEEVLKLSSQERSEFMAMLEAAGTPVAA